MKHLPARPPRPHRGAFDRTYEGLKPLLGPLHQVPVDAFDRTYEGLKHYEDSEKVNAIFAFDRTYEGLKQGVGDGRRPLVVGF